MSEKKSLENSSILENALNLRHFFEPLSLVLHNLGVRKILLFGSLVNNKSHPDSDIDVALQVYCGQNLALLNVQLDSTVAEVKRLLEACGYVVEVEGKPSPGSIHLRGVILDVNNSPLDFISYDRSLLLWHDEI